MTFPVPEEKKSRKMMEREEEKKVLDPQVALGYLRQERLLYPANERDKGEHPGSQPT